VGAGLVILIMSVTGALLAFESQIIEALERDVRHVPPSEPAKRIDASAIVTAAATAKPNAQPTGLIWHRWLGSEGQSRSTARAITGASNLAFLGLAVSGLFLWLPRSRARVKAVVVFDGPRTREGTRLQLARRDRFLVRSGPHRPHGHGSRNVVSLGQ
jgi:uncharacterized iron-regulated membrane protein